MNYDKYSHHRRSIRLKGYDYSQAGAYFVTICTRNRECLFGDIVDAEMRLNDAGHMVWDLWQKIPGHFPHADIDEFVVMPNHVHGIIVIVGAQFIAPLDCDAMNRNKIQGAMNHAPTSRDAINNKKPVGEIVRAFKARFTHAINNIRNTQGHPVWQRNYYEHIIRNEEEMDRIREYIIENPVKWAEDVDNPGRGLINQTPTDTTTTNTP